VSNFYTNVFQRGNTIFVRGFDDGERFQRKYTYSPYLFISSAAETGYKDIHENHVKQIDFSNINEAKDFIKQYDEVSGMRIYGYDRWQYMYIYDNYRKVVPDISKINIVGLDIEVASDDGFPEPDVAEKEVTAITLKRRNLTVVLGCGDFEHDMENLYYIKCKDEITLLRKFLKIWNEMDVDVVTGWNTEFFDIPYLVNRITRLIDEETANRMSPWNILRPYSVTVGTKTQSSYEMLGISNLDYLAVYKKFQLSPRESYRLDYIAEIELGEKKIDYSEYSNLYALYKENFQKFIEYNIRDVDLIFNLEDKLGYMNVIFALTYDSGCNYNDGLSTLTIWDTIIHNYLMDQRIVIPIKNNERRDAPQIAGGFVKDPIVGMHDWVMSFDLNSLYPHLIMQYSIGPDTNVSKQNLINWHSNLKSSNIDENEKRELMDSIEKALQVSSSVTVDDLIDKKYDLDFLKKLNLNMTANGQFYRTDKTGFLSDLMKNMYDDRVSYKKKMIAAQQEYQNNPTPELDREITRAHNMQYALKILLNSAYGAVANKYFRWFEQTNAEAITLSGQLSIRWIEKAINQYMNSLLKTNIDYVIAVDTDSVYINFGPLVKKVSPKNPIDFLDTVASEKFEPFIENSYKELRDYMNATKQMMVMKRENIGDKAIWTAKKRYIMNVWDSEGVRYNEAKLKIMGIEAIRSSTPKACRDYIKETLNLIMNTDELTVQKYIDKIRREFRTLPYEHIAFPRGINLMTKKTVNGRVITESYADPATIYKKATPIQVKGSLVYNHYIKKLGLEKIHEEIKDGEKIKYCYLLEPNPVRERVIACPNDLPDDLNLNKYIDYDTQFSKGYMDPIQIILKTIGWNSEKLATLDDFFS